MGFSLPSPRSLRGRLEHEVRQPAGCALADEHGAGSEACTWPRVSWRLECHCLALLRRRARPATAVDPTLTLKPRLPRSLDVAEYIHQRRIRPASAARSGSFSCARDPKYAQMPSPDMAAVPPYSSTARLMIVTHRRRAPGLRVPDARRARSTHDVARGWSPAALRRRACKSRGAALGASVRSRRSGRRRSDRRV